MAEPLAPYVHWPFFLSKCPYCDFNSHVRESVDQAEKYAITHRADAFAKLVAGAF